MPAFTIPMLLACAGSAAADTYLDPLNATAERFDLSTPPRRAMFLAQVAHESGGFKYTTELWGPTEAQQRYEMRADLGNIYPGDGSVFRGHGLIQITGRANHLACARYFGKEKVGPYDLIYWLQSPEGASLSAGWFWESHGCNAIADRGDFAALTRRINGGMNGYDDRVHLLHQISLAQ